MTPAGKIEETKQPTGRNLLWHEHCQSDAEYGVFELLDFSFRAVDPTIQSAYLFLEAAMLVLKNLHLISV